MTRVAVSPRRGGSTSPIVGSNRVALFCNDNADCHQSPRQKKGDGHEQVDDQKDLYDVDAPLRIMDMKAAGVYAVFFPASTDFAIEAKSFWQHTGELVSSHRAEAALVALGVWNTDHDQAPNDSREEEKRDVGGHLGRITSSFFRDASSDVGWVQAVIKGAVGTASGAVLVGVVVVL